MSSPVLVWFRDDLRLTDNPALAEAAATGAPIVPVYILEDGMGGACRWWLHHSLARLAERLEHRLIRKRSPLPVAGATERLMAGFEGKSSGRPGPTSDSLEGCRANGNMSC